MLGLQPRRSLFYRAKPKNDGAIAIRLEALAEQRPRWGWRRLHIMLKREKLEVGEHRLRRNLLLVGAASAAQTQAQSALRSWHHGPAVQSPTRPDLRDAEILQGPHRFSALRGPQPFFEISSRIELEGLAGDDALHSRSRIA